MLLLLNAYYLRQRVRRGTYNSGVDHFLQQKPHLALGRLWTGHLNRPAVAGRTDSLAISADRKIRLFVPDAWLFRERTTILKR